METKKNKKNPKKSKKKSDSPTIEVHPNNSPNKIDIVVSNNNNAININNSPKKEEKEEKIEKKDEKEEKEEKIDNIEDLETGEKKRGVISSGITDLKQDSNSFVVEPIVNYSFSVNEG